MNKEKTMTVQSDKMPSFITEEGFDKTSVDVSAEDVKMSQLKLLQKFKEDQGKPGEFIDTVSMANYGNSVEIIVLTHQKEWLKFDDNFKLDKRSSDGKFWDDSEPLTKDEQWKNRSHKFCILIADDLQPFPMFLSFMNTSYKGGNDLLNYIVRFAQANNEPVYARTYVLSSEKIEGKKGEYYTANIKPKGYVSKKETYLFAKEAADRIKNIDLSSSYVEPDENKSDDSDIEMD